jgi:aspartate aminotransferase
MVRYLFPSCSLTRPILLVIFEKTPLNPPDPIFNLNTQFKADQCQDKVNVGVGAYRTDEGKPWVLPVVKKAERMVVDNPQLDHEYLPIDGLAEFTEASARLVLGNDSPAIRDGRVRAFHAQK